MAFSLRLSSFFQARRALSRRRFAPATAGNAAIEFAIVGPVLFLMLSGIFTYGGYFLTAHTVQQITNDAARAAIGGLDDGERAALARQAVQAGLDSQAFMRGQVSRLDLQRSENSISVAFTYDASEDFYWAFAALVPVPSAQISRRATIRMGGY